MGLDDPDLASLADSHRALLQSLYGAETEIPELTAADLREGRGVLLVVRLDGRPAACGAVRLLDSATAELKQMHVARAARRRGVATALLRALEAEASGLGASRVVLETGDRQPEAVAFYESAGYLPSEPYEGSSQSAHGRCFSRSLLPVPSDEEDRRCY